MTSYNKSYITDFGSSWDQEQLHGEIMAEEGITSSLQGIEKTGDVIKITFDLALSSGEQTTLDTIITGHSPITNIPGGTFDAICDASGNSDYLLPSAAFADGHKSVFMRNGLYMETTDVVIPNYGTLVGESGGNVVIHFGFQAYGIVVDGSGGTQETTGTISITTGTTAITGSGTAFTNISITGMEYILLGSNYFKVASVESATSLTLVDTYQGATLSAMGYVMQKMYTGNQLKNFIITGSTTTGIHIRGNRHFVLDSIAIRENAPNLCVEYSGDSAINHLLIETGTGVGLILDHVISISLNTVDIYNHTSHGLEIKGTSNSVILNKCETSNNGGMGIRILGTATDIAMSDCIVQYNKSNGLFSNDTSHTMTVDSTVFRGNTLIGAKLDGSDHTFVGNIVKTNKSIGIDVLSGESVISNNIIEGNTDGIKLTGNKNICAGNQVMRNSAKGIFILGNDCIVSNNISHSNAENGANIETGATDTIVVYNNLKYNIGTNLVSNGTNSEITGNKS